MIGACPKLLECVKEMSSCCFFFHQYHLSYQYTKLLDCEGKTRRVGRRILAPTLRFYILHASHICPGGPLSALLAFKLHQLLPLHLNIELLQKELACPSKSLETIAIALRVQVCWSNSSIPAGCWLAIDCCYLCQCKIPQLVSNTKGSDQDLYWTIQPITSFFIKNLIVAVLCIQWLVSKWPLWLISIFITWALFLYLWQRFLLVMITLHSPK